MPKVLITGSSGMLGQDLKIELHDSFELCTPEEDELDIRDGEKVLHTVRALNPDFVINCAAYTNVDGCEAQRDLSFAVNAEGVKHIALACNEAGSVLYHISTDFVFDGKKQDCYVETDKVNPLSVYAASKLAGERHVQGLSAKYVIVRTSWLFGSGGNNFVSTIKKLCAEKEEISIVNDQIGCPTYTVDLAKAIKALLYLPAQGIYHICNAGMCSWYEYAEKIIEFLGCRTRVAPITSQQLARPAVRPAYSVMSCDKFISETGINPRPWEDALRQYLIDLERKE